MRRVSKCIPKQMRLSLFLKLSALSDGSRRSSGSAFQAMLRRLTSWRCIIIIGPATENTRRPSVLRRCRGMTRWWRLEDRSRWRLATPDVGWQQFMRYWGALLWRHRWTVTPSLWRIRCGTSSQCSSEWSRCVKPRWNFPSLFWWQLNYVFTDQQTAVIWDVAENTLVLVVYDTVCKTRPKYFMNNVKKKTKKFIRS